MSLQRLLIGFYWYCQLHCLDLNLGMGLSLDLSLYLNLDHSLELYLVLDRVHISLHEKLVELFSRLQQIGNR